MNNQKIGNLSSKDIESIHSQYLERIDIGIITEDKGIVICLDVLGWMVYPDGKIILTTPYGDK